MAKETARKKFKYVEGSELVSEWPAKNAEEMKEIDELNEGQQDYLQAGVVGATSWSFTTGIVESTGELESTGEVAESVAWLPDPVVSGALMRSVTLKTAIAKIKPGTLPGVGKFMCIAFELTPGVWGGTATVSLHSGTEQATAKAAEENPPATTAGKIQVRQVIVEAVAGPKYKIKGAQKDVRRPALPIRPTVSAIGAPFFLSFGTVLSSESAYGSEDFTVREAVTGQWEVKWKTAKPNGLYTVVPGIFDSAGEGEARIEVVGTSAGSFEVRTYKKPKELATAQWSFIVLAAGS